MIIIKVFLLKISIFFNISVLIWLFYEIFMFINFGFLNEKREYKLRNNVSKIV